jgi:Arm DNA-binding domain
MAREIDRLSARFVANAPRGKHADGQGLYLVNDGTKRWLFYFKWGNRRQEMGLGALADVSLKEARKARDAAREKIRAGVNPISERRAAKAEQRAPTFGEFAAELMAAKEKARPGWLKTATGKRWVRGFVKVPRGQAPPYAASLLSLRLPEVDTDAVVKALEPRWTTTPETADMLRRHIGQVLDAAKAKGLRHGDNPARWKGHLETLLPPLPELTRGHQRAIHYRDMPAVWKRLRKMPGISAKALQFTILTVAREAMTTHGSWPEIDRGERLWTIPKERMKGIAELKREHVVPLVGTTLKILDEVWGEDAGGYLFPSPAERRRGEPLSNAAMDKVCDLLEIDATPHGFRSTFKDWATNETDFADEVSEEVLAHVVGSKTRRAYRRKAAIDKRRRLLEAWEAFVTGG